MRSTLLLLRHSLKRNRTPILVLGALLAAFQVLLIAVGRSIDDNGAFDQLALLIPAFARELMGPAFLSFSGMVCLGYFHVAPMGALLALTIVLGTTPALEVETGFADLILARPLARHRIVTRTILMFVLADVLLVALMLAGTWAGLRLLGPKDAAWPAAKLVASLAVNLELLALSWGGIALAIGAASRRRGLAGGLAGFLALTTFLLDYLGRLWKPLDTVGRVSPFRYYSPFEMLTGTPLAGRDLAVLGAIAVASCAAAYVLFARRDISR